MSGLRKPPREPLDPAGTDPAIAVARSAPWTSARARAMITPMPPRGDAARTSRRVECQGVLSNSTPFSQRDLP